MEKGKKNIDELFAEARKSKITVPVDKVAKTILTGVAIGAASTAATAAAVTGKSILTLSTTSIMTGTLITAAVTATTIVVVSNSNNEETTVPAVDDKNGEYVAPNLAVDAIDDETIEYTDIAQPMDVENVIDDEELVMVEEDLDPIPPQDDEEKEKDKLVLSSNDTKAEFDEKIQELKDKGFKVNVGKVILDKKNSRLDLNFVSTTEANTVCGNLNLKGEFELTFEWNKNGRLLFTHKGNGNVNFVDTYETNVNGKKTTRVNTNTTKRGSSSASSSSSSSNCSTSIVTDDDGNTTIINNVNGVLDTLNINLTDFNLNLGKTMEKVRKQLECQMKNLDIQLENLHEQLEKIEWIDCNEKKKKEKIKEREKIKEKDEKGEKSEKEEKDGIEEGIKIDAPLEVTPIDSPKDRVEMQNPFNPRRIGTAVKVEEIQKVNTESVE